MPEINAKSNSSKLILKINDKNVYWKWIQKMNTTNKY